jgi:hypothetical protein
MANHINDPAHWAARAKKMRHFAEQTQDDSAKQAMIRVAFGYDKLAQRAMARSGGRTPRSVPPTLRTAKLNAGST